MEGLVSSIGLDLKLAKRLLKSKPPPPPGVTPGAFPLVPCGCITRTTSTSNFFGVETGGMYRALYLLCAVSLTANGQLGSIWLNQAPTLPRPTLCSTPLTHVIQYLCLCNCNRPANPYYRHHSLLKPNEVMDMAL